MRQDRASDDVARQQHTDDVAEGKACDRSESSAALIPQDRASDDVARQQQTDDAAEGKAGALERMFGIPRAVADVLIEEAEGDVEAAANIILMRQRFGYTDMKAYETRGVQLPTTAGKAKKARY